MICSEKSAKYLQIAENPHNNSSETQQLRRLERNTRVLIHIRVEEKRRKSRQEEEEKNLPNKLTESIFFFAGLQICLLSIVRYTTYRVQGCARVQPAKYSHRPHHGVQRTSERTYHWIDRDSYDSGDPLWIEGYGFRYMVWVFTGKSSTNSNLHIFEFRTKQWYYPCAALPVERSSETNGSHTRSLFVVTPWTSARHSISWVCIATVAVDVPLPCRTCGQASAYHSPTDNNNESEEKKEDFWYLISILTAWTSSATIFVTIASKSLVSWSVKSHPRTSRCYGKWVDLKLIHDIGDSIHVIQMNSKNQ